MSSSTDSMFPELSAKNSRSAIIYEKLPDSPPTVIVDNNDGYALYSGIPYGYKNTTLKYSNIKEVTGLNVYASNESIGVCIFKDGVMFSIVDMTLTDFFSFTPNDDSEVSIISSIQIDSDTIYIAAIVSTGGGNIVFSSKIVSFTGLIVSIPTTISHFTETGNETSEYYKTFNEDGSHTGYVPTDGELVTYESYNGSRGFGSIKTIEMDVENGTDNSIRMIYDEVIEDVNGFSAETFDLLVDKGVHSIESFFVDGSIVFIGLSRDKIFIITKTDDDVVGEEEYDFGVETEQDVFSNVYSYYSGYYPPKTVSNPSVYKKIYSPVGIVKMYNSPLKIVLSRVESVKIGDDDYVGIGSYEIDILDEDGKKNVSIDSLVSENNGKVYQSYVTKFDSLEYSDLTYTFLTYNRMLNTHIGDTDVAAKNVDTIHQALPRMSLPNQKVDIISVKSMANIMHYGRKIKEET